MITKTELDVLVEKYETPSFIEKDPIQFVHIDCSKTEKELYGFIASLFAYGNREVFIKKLQELFSKAENDLINFVKNGDFSSLIGFEYRFAKDYDIIPIFKILSRLYNKDGGLEELFSYAYSTPQDSFNYSKPFQTVVDYFYSNAPRTVKQGFYHMIPNPQNGGAMKRMNMFLRWMIRKGPVDLGIWDFITPAELMIPLDIHVAKISREMGLLTRKSNDYKAVLELTNRLKLYCPNDPVKYDFAMFAYDIELKKQGKL